MSTTDTLLRNNEGYARSFAKGNLPMPPAKRIAVLACMDARLDVHKILGLEEGDAHVIRNAGGVATDDAIRSLVISQRLLGTNEIVLIHHTDCGMLTFKDGAKSAFGGLGFRMFGAKSAVLTHIVDTTYVAEVIYRACPTRSRSWPTRPAAASSRRSAPASAL